MKNVFIAILSLYALCLTNLGAQELNYQELNLSEDSLLIKVEQLKFSLQSISEKEDFIKTYKNIGIIYQRINQFDSALYYYGNALIAAKEGKEQGVQSSILYNMSLVYRAKGNYKTALEHAQEALKLDVAMNDTVSITATLNSIALIYQDWGMYEKSLEYRLEAIELSERTKNWNEIANSKYNLGSLYLKTGKADKAMDYFADSRQAFEELLQNEPNNPSIKLGLSESVYSIAGIHLQQAKYTKALEEFSKALEIKTSISDKVGMANCYYQIGVIYLLQEDYDMARRKLFQSLTFKNMIGDAKGIALVYYQIANLYHAQGRLKESENFVNRSIAVAQNIGDKEILREDYYLLYQIYLVLKNSKQALDYHVLYKAYGDSVLNENATKIVEELSVRFETEKKEKENVLLQQENKISTLTIQKQKSMGRYLVGVIVLVLSIVVILYILFRSKQKTNKVISLKNTLLGEQNVQIATQKKEIEHKNRNLTDSIIYAKRIQESMLDDEQKFKSLVSEGFIFFKPKDIVSGDFYWFGEWDGKIIISAIDCTGHGVPGAFMSMLGNSFLNQIILNKGITSPDIILHELSKEVQIALKQAETNNRDGMDMALCTIDTANKVVEFSGAKNPLIYIKNGELVRIKGDKNPIGLSYGSTSEYEKHSVSLDETTCFYMFSDGYIDQFGGPKRKKFMIKNLQELLLEIHQKPMVEQKEILTETLGDWMKDEEQIDDILVVGFKING